MKGLLLITLIVGLCDAYPEKSLWKLNISPKNVNEGLYFSESMFNGTTVSLAEINCSPPGTSFVLTWQLFYSKCFQSECQLSYCPGSYDGQLKEETMKLRCDEAGLVKKVIITSSLGPEKYHKDKEPQVEHVNSPGEETDETRTASDPDSDGNAGGTEDGTGNEKDEGEHTQKRSGDRRRRKRDTAQQGTKDQPPTTTAADAGDNSGKAVTSEPKKNSPLSIAESWKDGEYFFKIQTLSPEGTNSSKPPKDWSFNGIRDCILSFLQVGDGEMVKMQSILPGSEPATIEVRDSNGHLLSAADFPYLYFYLILVILYVFYGIFWLFMMVRYWKDLLRIQYFLVLVILLGLLEKIVFYSEYKNVNEIGETTKAMVIFAELISVAKRTLSRALVIVVAVGYGIVKPRLGPTLHKLLAVSVIYFILATVEFTTKHLKPVQQDSTDKPDEKLTSYQMDNKSQMLAGLPLALCEVGILYWVFSSLRQTITALRLRRNVIKLQLYRHFTYLLIFVCLASAGFIAWSIPRIHLADCVTDMREIWLDEGFWTIEFSFMLLIIMILWRPSLNSSRFAKGLLLDQQDDEEEETLMMTEAFDSKKRNKSTNKKKDRKSREEKVEEDLQWIEDNIPASLADAAPGIIADSDEEIMTTRMELNKMD